MFRQQKDYEIYGLHEPDHSNSCPRHHTDPQIHHMRHSKLVSRDFLNHLRYHVLLCCGQAPQHRPPQSPRHHVRDRFRLIYLQHRHLDASCLQ